MLRASLRVGAFINPLSTGITFALTEKTTTHRKIPIITMGYGRADFQERAALRV